MSTRNYQRFVAFGLCFDSQLPLQELCGEGLGPHEHIVRSHPTDVHIRVDTVDELAGAPGADPTWWRATRGQLVLDIEGVARYSVNRGHEIIIDPAAGAGHDLVGTFLFGSAFGGLFHQRQLLPLHASAVEVNGEAVLFLGHTGAGKSTMAAALRRRGHKVVTDDIAVVSYNGRAGPYLSPGIPRLKLKSDAARQLGEEVGSLHEVTGDEGKYYLPLAAAEACG